jgi:hypothetical protein
MAGLKGAAGEFMAARAVVVMVSVEVAAPALTVTEAGEKPHAAPAGSPEQVNDALPVNPLLGVSVTVVCADTPAVTVPDVLDAERLKLGAETLALG